MFSAPAKINLFLAIDRKREDGYHDLRTLLHKITLEDVLAVEAREEISLETKGLTIPSDAENLILRATTLFSKRMKTGGAHVVLQKHIPVGAGLGGGSSDAAATLKALQKIYGRASASELEELAASLGADVPFFLQGQSAYATGIGTELHPLPSVELGWIVLVKPEKSLATADVYRELRREDYGVHHDERKILDAFYEKNISAIGDSLYNSLEAPAFRLLPSLQWMKDELSRLGGKALLSGSGSALFALFSEEEPAREALLRMKPHCDWSGLFRSGEIDEEEKTGVGVRR